jgi:secreted trypsin-like serine protease
VKRLITLVFALATGLSLLVTPAGAITGNFVDDNEHPYVGLVAFYDDEGNFLHRCSGALLTDRVFLTAGHCTEQDAGDASPVLARIWFHQNVGGAFNPPTVPEDPNTGYPNRCLPGDPLCAESTLLFDFGFDNFAGFPNTHDVGLIILPESEAVSLPEYGQLAEAGFLDSLASARGRQEVTFTVTGYGVSLTNPTGTLSFRERLMAETKLVNINSSNTNGFNLQLSSAPAAGRGGTCFGDSGGPVLYGGFTSNTIVAVNSFVLNQNCRGVGFGFRTDTQAVIDWILGLVRTHAPGELAEIEFVEAP